MSIKKLAVAAIVLTIMSLALSAEPQGSARPQDLRQDGRKPMIVAIQFKSVNCHCLFPKPYPSGFWVEVTVHGKGFGHSKETRVLVIDGQPAMNPRHYFQWTDSEIGFDFQAFIKPVWVDHEYQFAIGETRFDANPPGPLPSNLPNKPQAGVKIISPLFGYRFLVDWDDSWSGKQPISGKAGSAVTVRLCGIGSSQGNQVLMMGSALVTNIVAWGNPEGNIVFQVPSLPPGSYNIYIKRGGQVVSSVKPFTVLP